MANLVNFFTGLAFFYPPPIGNCPGEDAELTVSVFDSQGRLLDQETITLAPGQRISRLVPDGRPGLGGTGGWLRADCGPAAN